MDPRLDATGGDINKGDFDAFSLVELRPSPAQIFSACASPGRSSTRVRTRGKASESTRGDTNTRRLSRLNASKSPLLISPP